MPRRSPDGLERVRAAHVSLADPGAWLEGHGWDVDRWGRWPTADDLETVAPGRRCALWAHDHHSLLVSHAGLEAAGVTRDTPDPSGGLIRRTPDGDPEGVLQEAATRLVTVHIPPMAEADLEAAIVAVSLELLSLGDRRGPRPGRARAGPRPRRCRIRPTRACRRPRRLPVRVMASLREDSLDTALAGGLRSGAVLGADPDGRARIGWQKCFADGSLGSRTAALLADIEPEPGRPLAPELRRGVWITEPERLRELVAQGGGRRDRHADPRHRRRGGAGRARRPRAECRPASRSCPRSSTSSCSTRPIAAASPKAGIVASVQPVHLGSDAAQARMLWGSRAETNGYAWGSIAATGAVLAFGTDAPVEPFDPWPGIALAVRREDRRWPAGTPAFGPHEALTIEQAIRAACVGPATSTRETDRGRLTVGQRADLAVIPAACIDEPVEPGGALSTARPVDRGHGRAGRLRDLTDRRRISHRPPRGALTDAARPAP